MIFLEPANKVMITEHIENLSPEEREEMQTILDNPEQVLADLEELETTKMDMTKLNGGGMNVTSSVAVDGMGGFYRDVVFLADSRFNLNGKVYFANGTFAICLSEHIANFIKVSKELL